VVVEMLPILEKEAKRRQGERKDLTCVKVLTEVKRNPERATEHAAQIVGTNSTFPMQKR
jgi:hypothetical protein